MSHCTLGRGVSRALVVLFGALAVAEATGGAEILYSVSRSDALLRRIDPTDGSTLGAVPLVVPGAFVDGLTGLTTHPTTGELWAILKLIGTACSETDTTLARIDPCTGVVTVVGCTGDNFAGIAFSGDGLTLYGVTGDGGDTDPESLYELDQSDGTPTLLCTLGGGDDGEVLALNPDDGFVYHGSGQSTVVFERIDDTSLCTTTAVDITGTPIAVDDEEVRALTYWESEGVFLWKYGSTGETIFRVDIGTAPATVTPIGVMDHTSKGLAFVDCEVGACCIGYLDSCLDGVTEAECDFQAGVFQGDGSSCGAPPCPAPFVDCNENGVADATDIADGTSDDIDGNGIPDECLLCPDVDVVFIIDTSGSMQDEATALCIGILPVQAELFELGIAAETTFLGITDLDSDFFCVPDTVLDVFGPDVPGDGTCGPLDSHTGDEDESWAPATAIVADEFPWRPGAVRLIIPIGDEGPCGGDPCDDPGIDADAIANAIAVASGLPTPVIVSPITGTDADPCVVALAATLAAGTGGESFETVDPDLDLAAAVRDLVIDACTTISLTLEACCFDDGSCAALEPADCSAGGGFPQGAGSVCGTIDCATIQACCFDDDSCVQLTPGNCSGQGGFPQGPGTDCLTKDCTTIEACCFADGTCADLTPPNCMAAGGFPQGAGTDCLTKDCSTIEACCFTDGTCADLTPGHCTAAGGFPQGAGTDCAGKDCTTIEACCFADGTCAERTPANCTAAGGFSQGSGTSCGIVDCTTLGACCRPDDTCAVLATIQCTAQGGLPQGGGATCVGTDCSTVQACCFNDGGCASLTPPRCVDRGGFPQGDGTLCGATGCLTVAACCFDDGSCGPLTQENCVAGGGFYQGLGTECATKDCGQVDACCFADGTCAPLVPEHCLMQGGLPRGPGSSCADVLCGEVLETCLVPGPGGATGSWITFGGDDIAALPEGFFGAGSRPFAATVDLVGTPFDPDTLGSASTIIRRSGDPVLPSDPPGTAGVVEVEIVALQLRSVSPILVSFGPGVTERWKLSIDLSVASPPSPGSLLAIKTHANGGRFDAALPVLPRFTFERVTPAIPGVIVLDTGLVPLPPVELQFDDVPFVHALDPGVGLLFPASNLVPGVEELVPGDPTSQVRVPFAGVDPGDVRHTVCPPIPSAAAAIPTVQEWGLIVLALALLTAGTIVIRLRQGRGVLRGP
ncbi:MAG: hypothetical protein HKN62_09915 [Phycisphaerales bacterium]|nr:hypothetical protein [Phycisphaerales bacterium]